MKKEGDQSLSLTAEVLLLAIDPGRGLFPHDRRRLRRALAATHRAQPGDGGRLPWAAWGTRRSAAGELERAGLVQDGRLELVDRAKAAEHFRRVRRCIEDEEAAQSRDWELLLLLAWGGVLHHRLAKHERRVAFRRLRQLVRSAGSDESWQPPGQARQPMPTSISSLGGIVAMWEDIDLFDAPGMIDFGRDTSGFKPSSF